MSDAGQVADDPDEMLCERCRKLDLQQHMREWPRVLPNTEPPERIEEELAWMDADSMQNDCTLCAVLRRFVKQCQAEIDSDSDNTTSPMTGSVRLRLSQLVDWFDKVPRIMMYFSIIYVKFVYDARVWKKHLFPLRRPLIQQPGVEHRIGRRIDVSVADLKVIRDCLKNCETRHQKSRYTSHMPNRPVTTLHLIDCRTRKVRPAEPHETYICLSYVWGSRAAPALGQDGQVPQDIPKSLEDAMFVAKELGIPRLWVDQYCIDQTDLRLKAAAIKEMDVIYQGAHLTIVAASGLDAYSGLPGIRGTARCTQEFVKIGRCDFLVSQDICEYVQASRWNSRAWTYQEALLSDRVLIFTDTQLYFQCQNSWCLEQLEHIAGYRDLDFRTIFRVFPFRSPENGPHTGLRDLREQLIEYFQKKLSYGSDSVFAFHGILNASGYDHFFGIMCEWSDYYRTQSFLESLLWRPKERFVYNLQHHGQIFPSWTWASLKEAYPDSGSLIIGENTTAEVEPEDIQVQISHRTEGAFDLRNLPGTLKIKDYAAFFPYLDITAWTLRSRLTSTKNALGQPYIVFQGLEQDCLYLDDDRLWLDTEVVALYLGRHQWNYEHFWTNATINDSFRSVFLLVHDSLRIGLWFRSPLYLPPGCPVEVYDISAKLPINPESISGGEWTLETTHLY